MHEVNNHILIITSRDSMNIIISISWLQDHNERNAAKHEAGIWRGQTSFEVLSQRL